MKPTEYLFWFLFLVVNRIQNTLYYDCSKRVTNYVNNQSDCVAQILWLLHLPLQQKEKKIFFKEVQVHFKFSSNFLPLRAVF